MAILLRAKNRDPYTLAQTTSCLQHCSARGVILSKPSYICYFCLNITVLQFSLAPYAIRITYTKKNKIKYLCIEQVNLINLISALDFIDFLGNVRRGGIILTADIFSTCSKSFRCFWYLCHGVVYINVRLNLFAYQQRFDNCLCFLSCTFYAGERTTLYENLAKINVPLLFLTLFIS